MIHSERGKIDTFQVGDFSDITRIERNSHTFFFEIENKSPRWCERLACTYYKK